MNTITKVITGLLTIMAIVSCSGFGDQCVALCGGKDVIIIDMSKSEGKNLHEVWRWNIEEPTEGLPAEYGKYLVNDTLRVQHQNPQNTHRHHGGNMGRENHCLCQIMNLGIAGKPRCH